jgi:ribonucleoside-diphosphate reductase alpha chain
VVAALTRQPDIGTIHIEDIQDQVELALMRAGEHKVARAYVLYREERGQPRARRKRPSRLRPTLHMQADGSSEPLERAYLNALLRPPARAWKRSARHASSMQPCATSTTA